MCDFPNQIQNESERRPETGAQEDAGFCCDAICFHQHLRNGQQSPQRELTLSLRYFPLQADKVFVLLLNFNVLAPMVRRW